MVLAAATACAQRRVVVGGGGAAALMPMPRMRLRPLHRTICGAASPRQPQQQQQPSSTAVPMTVAAALSSAASGSFDSFDSFDDDGHVAALAEQQQQQQQPTPWRLPTLGKRARGLVLLNIMTVLMASNWSVLRDGATAATLTDGPTFMALRFIIAAAAFAPFLKPRDPKITAAGFKVGAAYAAGYVTQSIALGATSASRASLLSTFTVLAVPVIAALRGARIKPVVWACASAALVGTAMLEGGSALGPPNAGDAWAIVSAVLFALQITIAEKEMRALPKGSELPLMATSMMVVAATSALAAGLMHHHAGDLPAVAAGVAELASDWRAALPAALGGGAAVPAPEAREALKTLAQLVWTSIITTDAVLYAELVALQDVSSTDAAMTYSLEPVLGALIAYATLGERFGAWGWAGGALILASSLATQVAGSTQPAGGEGGGGDGGDSEGAAK